MKDKIIIFYDDKNKQAQAQSQSNVCNQTNEPNYFWLLLILLGIVIIK